MQTRRSEGARAEMGFTGPGDMREGSREEEGKRKKLLCPGYMPP